MIEVVLDFETCNPFVDLPTVGSRVYAEHWATEILCVCWDTGAGCRMGRPADARYPDIELRELAADPNAVFICHGMFEYDIWEQLMVPIWGYPMVPLDRWHDIQASAALRQVPLKLEKLLPALGLPHEKDKIGSKLTIALSKPDTRKGPKKNPNPNYGKLPIRTPEIMERVYAYCADDVANECAAHRRLGYLPSDERLVWLLDQRINNRGVALDRAFIAGAERIVDAAREPLIAEFRALTGLEPTQTKALVEWVRSQGVDISDVQKSTIAQLLGGYDDEDSELDASKRGTLPDATPGNVRRVLAIRSLAGSASIRKLSRMGACIGQDGRVRRLLQYHGTGPGRWAGRLFNPLNFPRGLVRDRPNGKPPDPELLAYVISTGDIDNVDIIESVVEDNGSWRRANAIEVVASALRHAIVADAGRQLVVGDFAGIQARLVLAMAGQHDKCALLASGADVYLDMAEDIFSVPKGSLDKHRDVEKRQIGKNTVLGCGFQMGVDKFHDKYCADKPREFAEQVIKAYREKWAPEVPKLWRGLMAASMRAVYDGVPTEYAGIEYRLEDGWLTARLYDGKKIYYWNPQRAKKRLPWADELQDCWTYQATKQGRMVTVYPHGGLLAENVVMGHERQLLVKAMFECEKNNLPVIFNGYDEIVCESTEGWPLLKQIMEDRPQWAIDIKLPVAAEGWTGPRYKKG